MRAIDTNVAVRLLTADDPLQFQAAKALIQEGETFVPITVVLEIEWVLRSGYGLNGPEIAMGLRKLGGLPGVKIEEAEAVSQAIGWMDEGVDFADALHLARTGHCTAFVTFDRKLAKRAGKLVPNPIELL